MQNTIFMYIYVLYRNHSQILLSLYLIYSMMADVEKTEKHKAEEKNLLSVHNKKRSTKTY